MNKINFLPPWVETNLQPAFYDSESGTCLQQTARMYAKVNQLVRSVNDQNETIADYIQQFIDLKDYCEDYFDNLDVQEEINNKLDEMAEDGTLQEIITAYIQSNVAWTFDTVADMKQATNLVAGSYARTLGFRSINDGGGAIYYITDSGTTDEMQIIAVGNLFANLVLTSEVTPEMFGAYGDGTTDDVTYIQKAIDSGRTVKLLHKTYLTSATLNIEGDYIEFNGTEGTIKYTGALNAILLKKIDHAKINLGKIEADNGNCIRGYSVNGTTSPKDYIVYLDLHFEQLKAKYKCISFETSGTGFINEVRLYGGNFAGGEYGVHFVSDPNHNFTGSNAFYCNDLCFEGTDNNYYFESPYHRFAGIVCENDRFVENAESTHLTLVGKFARSTFTSWGIMDESRMNLSLATVMLDVTFSFPIRSADMSKVYAQGIYYNANGEKTYIFKNHYAYTPSTYTANVTAGNIQCDKIGDICYLRLNGIKVDNKSCNLIDSDHALPVEFRPTNRNTSNICGATTGQVATFTVLKNGSISFYADDSSVVNKAFFGELVYDPLVNTNPE